MGSQQFTPLGGRDACDTLANTVKIKADDSYAFKGISAALAEPGCHRLAAAPPLERGSCAGLPGASSIQHPETPKQISQQETLPRCQHTPLDVAAWRLPGLLGLRHPPPKNAPSSCELPRPTGLLPSARQQQAARVGVAPPAQQLPRPKALGALRQQVCGSPPSYSGSGPQRCGSGSASLPRRSSTTSPPITASIPATTPAGIKGPTTTSQTSAAAPRPASPFHARSPPPPPPPPHLHPLIPQLAAFVQAKTGLTQAPTCMDPDFRLRFSSPTLIQHSLQCFPGTTTPRRSVYKGKGRSSTRLPDGRMAPTKAQVLCRKVLRTSLDPHAPWPERPLDLTALAKDLAELVDQTKVERRTFGTDLVNALLCWDIQIDLHTRTVDVVVFTPWAKPGSLRSFLLDVAAAAFRGKRSVSALSRRLIVTALQAKVQQLIGLTAAGVTLSDAKLDNDVVCFLKAAAGLAGCRHASPAARAKALLRVLAIDLHGGDLLCRAPGADAAKAGCPARTIPRGHTVYMTCFLAPEQCRGQLASFFAAASSGDVPARLDLAIFGSNCPGAKALNEAWVAGGKRSCDPLGEGPWAEVRGVLAPVDSTCLATAVWHLGACLLELVEAVEGVLEAGADRRGGEVSAQDKDFLAGLQALGRRCMQPRPSQRPGLDELHSALERLAP
ncbi:hypothetical protein HYH03_000473 [Edaphochlamys debaryana]|uniref:Protein kinase domain-containing protein n=1 Tax=Edaphochlamys debaryana TaxID=47281 RepID=A0A835YFJ2_9CHLO|nr:hypothetical protein HYH03_000473 [Edaphochlamys debaryana]|eukprot:KAG2501977.1 hypothetical protein HYH03_000473 [Edaphochlamys debaryana]